MRGPLTKVSNRVWLSYLSSLSAPLLLDFPTPKSILAFHFEGNFWITWQITDGWWRMRTSPSSPSCIIQQVSISQPWHGPSHLINLNVLSSSQRFSWYNRISVRKVSLHKSWHDQHYITSLHFKASDQVYERSRCAEELINQCPQLSCAGLGLESPKNKSLFHQRPSRGYCRMQNGVSKNLKIAGEKVNLWKGAGSLSECAPNKENRQIIT